MSANIYYMPLKKVYSMGVNTPSSFISVMTGVFGEFPIELDDGDIPILRGMAVADRRDESDNPYYATIRAIEQHGKIKVWAEH